MTRKSSDDRKSDPSVSFSREDLESIIREALEFENQDSFTYDELLDTAGKLGISEETIRLVMENRERNRQNVRSEAQRKRELNSYILHHGGRFLLLSLFFIILNVFTGRFMWCVFPILGIGLGYGFRILERIRQYSL